MDKEQSITYVFLSHPITGIGGAQVYVRDKSSFLKKLGYRVLVFSGCNEGEFIIKEFLPYKDFVIPQLLNKPFIYSRKQREKVVSKMIEILGNSENVLLESSDINSGEWGELLASRVKARHIIFCLSEQFSIITKSEESFLLFKHKRKELFGINESTLPLLFHRDMPKEDCFFWKAVSDNSPIDVYNKEIENIKKRDFNIGSIGRYDKPFFPTMIKDLSDFVKTHPNNSINIVLCIGSHMQTDEAGLLSYFEGLNNVDIHIFGPLNPLPVSLFKLCDVFISTAGCAGISLRMNVPTITLDAFDFKPIGVLGFTTHNTTYRCGEEKKDLNELLEDVLIKQLYRGLTPQKPSRDIELHYNNQLKDVLIERPDDYFDFERFKPSLRMRIMKFFMLFGDAFYDKLRRIVLR